MINVNNTLATGDILFRHTQNQLVLPRVVNYSGAATVNLNMGSGNDNVFIDGAATGTTLTVNANAGNDNITVGSGNVDANLLGPVTVNGGAGVNTATVNNTSDASAESQVLNRRHVHRRASRTRSTRWPSSRSTAAPAGRTLPSTPPPTRPTSTAAAGTTTTESETGTSTPISCSPAAGAEDRRRRGNRFDPL